MTDIQSVHWRTVSQNPVDPKVIQHQAEWTRSRCKPHRGHPDTFLKEFVSGQSVLDIGCAEHDVSHWEHSNWQHAKLRNWAVNILGVDILPEAVQALTQKGFKAVCADATSNIDLGSRFDRVIVGDVLEHVDRPVDLIRFAVRHLKPGGLALMRTPNPFWWKHFMRTMFAGIMLENAEHVAWVTPCCAIELAHRAEAQLIGYHPQIGRFSRWSPLYWFLSAWSGRTPEIFASSYMYVFSHKVDE